MPLVSHTLHGHSFPDLLKLFYFGAPCPSPSPKHHKRTHPYIYWHVGGCPSTERSSWYIYVDVSPGVKGHEQIHSLARAMIHTWWTLESPVSVIFAALLATNLIADPLTHLLLQVQVGLEPMKAVAHSHTFHKI